MATLKKRRSKFYARVVWRVNGKLKEIQIPLKTSSLTEARTRLHAVNNEEIDIRDGIIQPFQYKNIFRWLNQEGTSRYESLKLVDIIPEYLKYLGRYGRKATTIERRGQCLNNLVNALGANFR